MSRSSFFAFVLFAVAACSANVANAAQGYQVAGYEPPTVSSTYTPPGYGEVRKVRPRVVWHHRATYTNVGYSIRPEPPCE